jgi:hypothetical protein
MLIGPDLETETLTETHAEDGGIRPLVREAVASLRNGNVRCTIAISTAKRGPHSNSKAL